MIEVKRSESRSYLVDGVYKLMGYLKDYERTIITGINQVKGILVGWKLPESGDEKADKEILLSDHINLNLTYEKVLY